MILTDLNKQNIGESNTSLLSVQNIWNLMTFSTHLPQQSVVNCNDRLAESPLSQVTFKEIE